MQVTPSLATYMHSIQLVKCEKQVDNEDCGIFTIAFAASIAFVRTPVQASMAKT